MKQQIGARMKENYEEVFKIRLPMRMPVIMRLDGKAFHSFTSGMKRPFDDGFIENMALLAQHLCINIQGAEFAYVQSDEISILLHNYKKLDSQAWFGNEVQKMTSISAGLASSWFSQRYQKTAIFDSRVFVIPETEVVNYFIWRQQDATRNSISMVAQSLYSHKQLMNKNSKVMQEMIHDKGVNWGRFPIHKRRGLCICDEEIDMKPPVFTKNRKYIEKYLALEEE